MATFAIGDIHGCLTALKAVVAAADVQAGDTLVYLGDYVDRGPDSRAVIDWILEQRTAAAAEPPGQVPAAPTIITLRGNHEVMMLQAREDAEYYYRWQSFGGEETLQSYGGLDGTNWVASIPDSHWEFLNGTEKFYATDTHIFVHAGLRPKLALDKQDDVALYWKKYRKPRRYLKDKIVISGHTTHTDGNIVNHEHTVQLDTYAYGGQWLTCLNVDSGEYWQANQEGDQRGGNLSDNKDQPDDSVTSTS